MNFYLNYYREEMNTEGDTEPIGIVLGAYEDKLVMQYALQGISNQVFVSRYQPIYRRENSLRQSLSVLWRVRIIRKSLKPELVRRHLTNSGSPYGEQTSATS